MVMPKVAIIAALEREVSALIKSCRRVERDYEGRRFIFFERDELVVVCGGVGAEAARLASEAMIALYRPTLVLSAGFAGALDAHMPVGEIFAPALVVDARDGSRVEIEGGKGTLVTFMAVASVAQKANLAQAYKAQAVDMEAAAVATAARTHGIEFGVTKVISDESHFEMPQMDRFIDAFGRFRTSSFALFVTLRPWLWRRVAILASNSRKAARALGEHLERLRQELSQASGRVAPPPTPAHSTAQAAAASGLRARGRE
jgi:adenosylhomocysteine nucleosidase